MSQIKTEAQEVKELGERIGYGNMMVLASALWRKKLEPDNLEDGAFIPVLPYMVNKKYQKDKAQDAARMDDIVKEI